MYTIPPNAEPYPSIFTNQKYQLIILGLLCIIPYFINSGVLDPGIMEARNYITAREIVENDTWLVPTMNGYPRLEKPPLPTWITAVAGLIAGDIENLVALRFPAGIITCVMALFLFFFTKSLTHDRLLPFLSTAVLVTSFYIIYMGRQGTWDIYCHSFMLGAIWLLFDAWQKKLNGYWRFVLVGILLGFSFLSKGPIAFYALLLPFLIAYFVGYGFQGFKYNWKGGLLALFVGVAISAAWPLFIYLMVPEDLKYMVAKETGSWADRHVRPFWQYWSFPFQSGIWGILAIAALVYPYAQKRIDQYGNYIFLAVWVIAGVFLLSLIPEKKERYLLPVLIPLALLTAFYIRTLIDAFDNQKRKKADFWIFSFNAIFFTIVSFAVPIFFYIKISSVTVFGLISISLLFFGISFLFYQSFRKKNVFLLFLSMVLLTISVILAMPPFVKDFMYTNTTYKSLRGVRTFDEFKNLKFYSVGEIRPEQIWEVGKPIDTLKVIDNRWNIRLKEPVAIFSYQPLQELLPVADSLKIEELAVYPYDRAKTDKKLYFSRVTPK